MNVCRPHPWRDMASAPKDGTHVVLSDWMDLVMVGYWDGTNWVLTMTGAPVFEPVMWQPIPPMFESSL